MVVEIAQHARVQEAQHDLGPGAAALGPHQVVGDHGHGDDTDAHEQGLLALEEREGRALVEAVLEAQAAGDDLLAAQCAQGAFGPALGPEVGGQRECQRHEETPAGHESAST